MTAAKIVWYFVYEEELHMVIGKDFTNFEPNQKIKENPFPGLLIFCAKVKDCENKNSPEIHFEKN